MSWASYCQLFYTEVKCWLWTIFALIVTVTKDREHFHICQRHHGPPPLIQAKWKRSTWVNGIRRRAPSEHFAFQLWATLHYFAQQQTVFWKNCWRGQTFKVCIHDLYWLWHEYWKSLRHLKLFLWREFSAISLYTYCFCRRPHHKGRHFSLMSL